MNSCAAACDSASPGASVSLPPEVELSDVVGVSVAVAVALGDGEGWVAVAVGVVLLAVLAPLLSRLVRNRSAPMIAPSRSTARPINSGARLLRRAGGGAGGPR